MYIISYSYSNNHNLDVDHNRRSGVCAKYGLFFREMERTSNAGRSKSAIAAPLIWHNGMNNLRTMICKC